MEQPKLDVAEMCASVGWTPTDLMRESGIAWNTARSVYDGQEPSERIKRQICQAFSHAFGRTVLPGEIAWNVRRL